MERDSPGVGDLDFGTEEWSATSPYGCSEVLSVAQTPPEPTIGPTTATTASVRDDMTTEANSTDTDRRVAMRGNTLRPCSATPNPAGQRRPSRNGTASVTPYRILARSAPETLAPRCRCGRARGSMCSRRSESILDRDQMREVLW